MNCCCLRWWWWCWWKLLLVPDVCVRVNVVSKVAEAHSSVSLDPQYHLYRWVGKGVCLCACCYSFRDVSNWVSVSHNFDSFYSSSWHVFVLGLPHSLGVLFTFRIINLPVDSSPSPQLFFLFAFSSVPFSLFFFLSHSFSFSRAWVNRDPLFSCLTVSRNIVSRPSALTQDTLACFHKNLRITYLCSFMCIYIYIYIYI